MLQLLGALVLLDAITGKHLDVNHRAIHARGYSQRSILHIGGFLAKDRPQEFFFRRQLGFALGSDLAHQNVARLDLGTDIHDAGFIQLGEGSLAHIRDVSRDFFRTQLGVAGHAGFLFNVDGGEAILLDHPLGNQNRILEVVTVPWHERDQEILAQRQLTHIG